MQDKTPRDIKLKLLNECDASARSAIINYFKKNNINLTPHEDKYDIDLIWEEEGRGFEIEVHKGWQEGNHYRNVHLWERKRHYFDGRHELDNYFIVLNKSYTKALIAHRNKITPFLIDEFAHEQKCLTNGVSVREKVYDIPLEMFQEVNLNN